VDIEREVPGKGHLFNICNVGVAALGPVIDDPHDDAAEEQGQGHDGYAAQMLVTPFVEKKSGDGGEGERNEGERDGVIEPGAVAVFAARKGADELDDAAEKQQRESKDGAKLNDDGVHLPVGVVEGDLHEAFGNAEMCCRADWQELGQAFHDAENDRLKIGIQEASVR
jgi:hypothetical protein